MGESESIRKRQERLHKKLAKHRSKHQSVSALGAAEDKMYSTMALLHDKSAAASDSYLAYSNDYQPQNPILMTMPSLEQQNYLDIDFKT